MSFDDKNIKLLSYQPEQPLDESEIAPETTPFIHDEQSALNELWAMLKTMRPAYSVEERRFIRKWIKRIKDIFNKVIEERRRIIGKKIIMMIIV